MTGHINALGLIEAYLICLGDKICDASQGYGHGLVDGCGATASMENKWEGRRSGMKVEVKVLPVPKAPDRFKTVEVFLVTKQPGLSSLLHLPVLLLVLAVAFPSLSLPSIVHPHCSIGTAHPLQPPLFLPLISTLLSSSLL